MADPEQEREVGLRAIRGSDGSRAVGPQSQGFGLRAARKALFFLVARWFARSRMHRFGSATGERERVSNTGASCRTARSNPAVQPLSRVVGLRHSLNANILVGCFTFIGFLLLGLAPQCRGAEVPEDLVTFFKGAIVSPPDVKYFRASQQRLTSSQLPAQVMKELTDRGLDINKPSPPTFFEGARSGENFLLSQTQHTNSRVDFGHSLSQPDLGSRIVSGRVGSNSYQVGLTQVRQTFEQASFDPANPPATWSKASYNYVNELFCMGLGSVKAGSAVWHGNELNANTESGRSIHAELTLSNRMPHLLTVRMKKGESPFSLIQYVYSDAGSLRGYPSRMIRSIPTEAGWRPAVEWTLLEVQLAEQPLGEEFFSPARFTAQVQFTNVYSNRAAYTLLPDGKTRRNAPASDKPADTPVNPTNRIIVLSAFFFLTATFMTIAFRHYFRKSE